MCICFEGQYTLRLFRRMITHPRRSGFTLPPTSFNTGKVNGLECFISTSTSLRFCLILLLNDTYNKKKWVSTWENLPFDTCDQRRFKSACESAQSNLSLNCPHEETMQPWLSKKCAKLRFWSDCAYAQSDLNLHWADMSEGTFSDIAASVLMF